MRGQSHRKIFGRGRLYGVLFLLFPANHLLAAPDQVMPRFDGLVPPIDVSGPWATLLTMILFLVLFRVSGFGFRKLKNLGSPPEGTTPKKRLAAETPVCLSRQRGSWDLRLLPYAGDAEIHEVFRTLPLRSAIALLAGLDVSDRQDLLARLHLANMLRKGLERSTVKVDRSRRHHQEPR